MVELADTLDLGSSGVTRGGSSPSSGTNKFLISVYPTFSLPYVPAFGFKYASVAAALAKLKLEICEEVGTYSRAAQRKLRTDFNRRLRTL